MCANYFPHSSAQRVKRSKLGCIHGLLRQSHQPLDNGHKTNETFESLARRKFSNERNRFAYGVRVEFLHANFDAESLFKLEDQVDRLQ